MIFFEIISIIIGICGLALILLQLRADHERRKKQATIEYLSSMKPVWLENEKKIYKAFGKKAITEEDVQELLKDESIRDEVKTLLGRLEYMAVGMNTGVYDKHLLYRMAASYFIGIYHRLYPYIEYVQDRENQFAYIEFKELVTQFEEQKRKKPDPRGNIKLS